MNEKFSVSDYGIFSDAINTTTKLNTSIIDSQTIINETSTKLKDETIFMGPCADSCATALATIDVQSKSLVENFNTINEYLKTTAIAYQKGDKKASEHITNTSTNVKNQSTSNKNINTSSVKDGTNVANALKKYGSELDNADYATVSENLFTTTTTEYINGQPVKVTHVVINNGSQINGAPANGSYGNGLETSSNAANRLNSSILINGSHFNYSNGSEDLKGGNNVVIVNGKIKHDGTTGGQELLLDSNGNIYNAQGKSAQELVDNGVKYTFSCHSTQVIENGNTSPSYREGNLYKRNVIGQVAPGEYYIITDTTYNNKLSDTAEYLKGKGCNNAYSLDQGGSVSLVRDDTLINNPSDKNGERAVGDFLYFTA